MRILLDTQVLLWALHEPERLPPGIASELSDRSREVLFSAASIWEVGIKASLGRDDFRVDPDEVWQLALRTGFIELPIRASDGAAVRRLPWHHRDPFDRLLVAQAMALPAYLYTSDTLLTEYTELVFQINK